MNTETKNMTVETIVSGNFSGKGNFSGYNSAGTRFFISGRQMEKLGITKDEEVKQFYITSSTRTFNELDGDGNVKTDEAGNTLTFERTQAGACFATQAEAIDAITAPEMIAIATETRLSQARSDAKLELAVAYDKKLKELAIEPDVLNKLLGTV